MSFFLGYGHEVWAAGNYYFWIPMVAPFFGCTFGGWLYDMFIFTGESISNGSLSSLTCFCWAGVPRIGRGVGRDNRE